ncbi:hypothetical protein AYO38_09480 [bacterium SCGC AG-212-C10]|nr:hypothetical protein AYO38_09480 [bacterium SCGC AG-212-C10]
MPAVATRQLTDYAELKKLVAAKGLLRSQTPYYVMKTVCALGTLAAAVVIAIVAPNNWVLFADAVFLAFASTQIALLAHDVGHRQAFRGRRTNRWARLLFGNLLLGVSHSWWNNKHNQHHATPNHLDKDPDIQFPMIAFAPAQIPLQHTFLRSIMGIQAFVFIAVLPLQAANMRYTSLRHVFSGQASRPVLQAAVIGLHFALYGWLLFSLGGWLVAIAFFAIHQGVFGLYNSSVFASNHKGMVIIEEGARLGFLQEQVLTSRNVHGHKLTDFWYGGLNYQIEHHLFPTMPRNRLAEAQVIVREFCDERGIPHHSTGLFASYREGFMHLHRTGAGARGNAIPA